VTFIPYELMHKKWQYHLLQMLREHVDDPRVEQDIDRGWKNYPNGFVAYLQPGDVPPGGKGLAEYLAKYVVSPPISVRRLEDYDGHQVSYWYKDHKTQAIEHATLPVLRFIGRMVQHILPKGFQRIRYFGLHSHPRYQQVREQLATLRPASTPLDWELLYHPEYAILKQAQLFEEDPPHERTASECSGLAAADVGGDPLAHPVALVQLPLPFL
jgi:hypothetical protein